MYLRKTNQLGYLFTHLLHIYYQVTSQDCGEDTCIFSQRFQDPCKIFNSIVQTCSRFEIVNQKARKFLPRIHVKQDDNLKKNSSNTKIYKSVHVPKRDEQSSGILLRIAELANDKRWNTAWLLLVKEEYFSRSQRVSIEESRLNETKKRN